jgi:DNA modification methylase
LDPFGGAGTTGIVANEWNRKAILVELNPSYVDMGKARAKLIQPQLHLTTAKTNR